MGTWIVGTIVFCLIGLAAYKTYKDRKNGKSCGCGESCSSCGKGCQDFDGSKKPLK